MCVNLCLKFLPAPEYPDLESIVMLSVFIKDLFKSGSKRLIG